MLAVEADRYLVSLRFTQPGHFHFNHGGALMGLLCRASRTHDLHAGVAPFASESGRVRFAPGDAYRFGLTLAGAARADFSVEEFRAGLRRIGARAPDPNQPLPTLGGNFEVVAVEPSPLPPHAAETAKLARAPSLTLRLLSPLRVERPTVLKQKGAGYLNADCFPLSHFTRRLLKRLFLLAHERYPSDDELEALLPTADAAREPNVSKAQLLWLDIPLEGAPGKRPAQGYTLGGIVGKIVFRDVPESWLPFLLAGQDTHAGEKTHYGLGRYLIEECRAVEADPFRPGRTLYEDLTDAARLEAAFNHVIAHSTAAGVDDCEPGDCADEGEAISARLAGELRGATYRPAPLRGFVATKKDAGLRALTIPTVRDRVVQRAACDLLSPSIEKLLEDCSYAYRKGFSRAGAARAIERAYEDGFRYVLDADIESFFDAVEWSRLFGKLEALFPFEPLVELIKEWVRAPVSFEHALVERTRGLPQGIPVAPLLANLYLDEFDEELLGRDYRLVRFADDFIVLCKDLDAAGRAREDARRALARLGLTLNEDKTAIRSFEEGFNYLGYLFCRSLTLESAREGEAAQVDLAPDAISAASWLAQVPFERVRALVLRRGSARANVNATANALDSKSPHAPRVEIVPLRRKADAPPPGEPAARTLYVTSYETTIRREGETLAVCAPGESAVNIPARAISQVVCVGAVRVTLPVLLALAERGVPSYFCRASGELIGVFAPPHADWSVWMGQARAAADEQLRLRFAREVVAAKLHNFGALVSRFGLGEGATRELRELERDCENKTTLEALCGLEGRGATRYFQSLRATLDEEWGFAGRHTRPPPDPVNAMLSFGYTLLYHHISTALVAAGLNPRVGLFHTERGTYHALACDVQEEFRHLVDAQLISMINRREVAPANFHSTEDGRYPCLMDEELRRKFISTFERRLAQEFIAPDGAATTYRAFIESQVARLKDFIAGRAARYEPFRTRSR